MTATRPSTMVEDDHKVIWGAQEWGEQPITASEISATLGVSPSSASGNLKRLSSDALVAYEPRELPVLSGGEIAQPVGNRTRDGSSGGEDGVGLPHIVLVLKRLVIGRDPRVSAQHVAMPSHHRFIGIVFRHEFSEDGTPVTFFVALDRVIL